MTGIPLLGPPAWPGSRLTSSSSLLRGIGQVRAQLWNVASHLCAEHMLSAQVYNTAVKAQRQLMDPSQAETNWATLSGWKAFMVSKGPLSYGWSQANGCIRQSFFKPRANYRWTWQDVFPQLLNDRAQLHEKLKNEDWEVAWLQMQIIGLWGLGLCRTREGRVGE